MTKSWTGVECYWSLRVVSMKNNSQVGHEISDLLDELELDEIVDGG